MKADAVREKFDAALSKLVVQIKDDRSIVAAILGGSLSHDTVWAKSDIDLVLITIDDKKVESSKESGLALYSDGVNLHAWLLSRTDFRRIVEGALHQSFLHSFLSKGKLLYSHDPTVEDLCRRLQQIGERDTQLQLLRAGTHVLPPLYKAHKWFLTRGDLDYTALWILYTTTPLAQVEVFSRRLLADREVIPQALALNPPFFETVYTNMLNKKKTRDDVQNALSAIDAYIADRTDLLFAPVIEHLRDVRETRSASDIENHFHRNFDIGGITTACEYLADREIIGKVSTPVQLTKRSNVQVQELAFFYVDR